MVHVKVAQCSKEKKSKSSTEKKKSKCGTEKKSTKGEEKSQVPKEVSPKAPLIEFPHFLRTIGPKQINVLMQFVPSALVYSVTSLALMTYMSEWKAVLQYVPYYNGKYVEKDTVKDEDAA